MAINPDQDLTQTITTSAARTLRKVDLTGVSIQPDPDGKGRVVRIDVAFADGTTGTSYQQFKDVGTLAQRNAVKDWLTACHLLGAASAGFTG